MTIFIKFLRRNVVALIAFILMIAITELGSVLLIIETGLFMESYVKTATMLRLTRELYVLFGLLILVLLAGFFNKAFDFYLSNKALISIEAEVLDHLMHVELEETLTRDKIELAQQVNNDVVVVTDYFLSQYPNLLVKLCKAALMLLLCAKLSSFTAFILLGASLIYFLVYIFFQQYYKRLNADMLKAQQGYFAVLGGELLHVFLVQANSWYERTVQQFLKAGAVFVNKSIRFLNFDFFLSNIIQTFTRIFTILIPVFLLLRGEASFSSFFILLTFSQLFLADITDIMDRIRAKNRKDVSLARLQALLRLPQQKQGEKTINHIYSLTTEELSFTYRGAQKKTLAGMNLSFKANDITVLVGENGAGKSTLVKLLLGLLQASEGSVKINREDISSLNMEKVRKQHIALCEQEPYLLHDTILNNLNCGLQEEKSVEYYREFSLLDFVDHLDDGYETMISSGSQNLSGGQKQKIALVRTLAKDASFLIFDEPTSALDSESVEAFLRLLQTMKQGRMILIISHHEKVIEHADEVHYI